MRDEIFWLSVWTMAAVAFLALVGLLVCLQQHSNIQTLKCYEILKDKSASDLRITCGWVR